MSSFFSLVSLPGPSRGRSSILLHSRSRLCRNRISLALAKRLPFEVVVMDVEPDRERVSVVGGGESGSSQKNVSNLIRLI